jgi:hypothetical protein
MYRQTSEEEEDAVMDLVILLLALIPGIALFVIAWKVVVFTINFAKGWREAGGRAR